MSKKKSMYDTNVTNQLFKQSGIENTFSYLMYFNRLCELAISIFKWKDLPETCDERFLEACLMEKGYVLFFKDEIMGFLALPCTIGGTLSVYNIPKRRMAYANNGYQNYKTEADSVIIYNNMLRTNDYQMIEYYANRLWFIDQIIDVNVNAQKTPVLIEGDQKQKLTLKNLYQKYDGNQPFIFGDSSLGTQPLKAIATGAPYVGDKLYNLRTNIWQEALSYIGVPNVSIQKKERMLTDEVQSMNGGTISSRFSRLQARKQACDMINRMFDLNISVEVRAEVEGADINPPAKPDEKAPEGNPEGSEEE